MFNSKKQLLQILIPIVVVVGFFIVVSLFMQEYAEELRQHLDRYEFFGYLLYILISILAVVAAPFSSLPFVPVAAGLWGPLIAALLTLAGWTVGAVIAYILAQRFGQPFVKKIISLERLRLFEKVIPEKNIFWTIFLLRMIVPTDILSYALGLFTKISMRTYFFATLFGIAPFTFVFSYTATFPLFLQLGVFAVFGVFVFFLVRRLLSHNAFEKK